MQASTPERYLHITANGEAYGVPLRQLLSVEPMARVVPLPNAPPWLLGVTYRQGRVYSVADLNALLDPEAPPTPSNESARLLIVADQELAVALAVPAATDVFVVTAEQVEPAPPVSAPLARQFLSGQIRQAESVFCLLDLGRLLHSPDFLVTV